MRQRATVKLFQMVGAAEKAALRVLVKYRPGESPNHEKVRAGRLHLPKITLGSGKRSQPKRRA